MTTSRFISLLGQDIDTLISNLFVVKILLVCMVFVTYFFSLFFFIWQINSDGMRPHEAVGDFL